MLVGVCKVIVRSCFWALRKTQVRSRLMYPKNSDTNSRQFEQSEWSLVLDAAPTVMSLAIMG